jgi:hypothetical protein
MVLERQIRFLVFGEQNVRHTSAQIAYTQQLWAANVFLLWPSLEERTPTWMCNLCQKWDTREIVGHATVSALH